MTVPTLPRARRVMLDGQPRWIAGWELEQLESCGGYGHDTQLVQMTRQLTESFRRLALSLDAAFAPLVELFKTEQADQPPLPWWRHPDVDETV